MLLARAYNVATVAGESKWISSPEGRSWALEERDCHDAILVGSGTALADDPRLDRRSGSGQPPASGHVAGFTDPLVDCTNCKNRFRLDKLDDQAAIAAIAAGYETLIEAWRRSG